MKRIKSICIFLYSFLCVLTLGSLSIQLYRDNCVEESPMPQAAPKVVPAGQNKEFRFVVVEESDVLVVYYVKNHVKYLGTDISVDTLPKDIQKEVKEGISFYDEKSLYDFLENYSS